MMADDRHEAAIYAIVRTERDQLGLSLMHYFCLQSGWHSTAYVDRSFPRGDKVSAWDKLLDAISHGQYYAVVMAWEATGMAEYCDRYNAHLVQLDPFAMAGSSSWGRSTRLC